MLKRKLFSCLAYVVFAASLFATACSGRKTQQESVELKKIVIAEPLHSIGYLPLYIGQQEGFFAEEGLDVEVIQATGGSHVTSVMSGDAWGVIGGVGFKCNSECIRELPRSGDCCLQLCEPR